MSRKDDPVFNVKFVHLVESHPCLWNSKLPAYSKKDETQNAWQEVANATNESVQNCRERWRTIRSSFLRSLKMSRTTTGRGKRKYYLSKYLQFLIPYTKTRPKNGKQNATATTTATTTTSNAHNATLPPMTHISNMPVPVPAASNDDTKDYGSTEVEIAEEDIVVSLNDGSTSEDGNPSCSHTTTHTDLNGCATTSASDNGFNSSKTPTQEHQHQHQHQQHHHHHHNQDLSQHQHQHQPQSQHQHQNLHHQTSNQQKVPMVFPLPMQRLTAIKTEVDTSTTTQQHGYQSTTLDHTSGDYNGMQQQQQQHQHQQHHQQQHQQNPHQQPHHGVPASSTSSAVDLTEFAEWIKSKNVHQRHCLIPSTLSPDADQSFLNSLHPYMKEMTGKQNRRFRQKVVALIDAILDNAD